MNYQSLCTEYYLADRPWATEAELDFYERELLRAPGPYLEAMCGAGQFLLPLRERGLEVDGFDRSPHMARVRPEARVIVGEIETIELPRKYGAIFVATGSFQLVHCPRAALDNLRRHLTPEGVLLVEVWIPWEAIETGQIESGSREVSLNSGEVIRLESKSDIDRNGQLLHNRMRFTKIQKGKEVEQEEEELSLRWHYRTEMELLLERAGFSKIEEIHPNEPYVPHSIVYRAFA